MKRRKSQHKVGPQGPGRMRIKIASMLKRDLGIDADPYELFVNNSPSDRLYDMARWGGEAKRNGLHVHVCSWDRMTDIIKAGCVAVVEDNPHHFEVCRGSAQGDDQ